MCNKLESIKNLTFHLTVNEKRFVEESIKILLQQEPNIIKHLSLIIDSFKESKDKVSCGKQLVNHIFKIRYPIISKKLKLLNKLKVELKQFGIKLSYDKMLEQDPKIVLSTGKEVVLNKQFCLNEKDLEIMGLDTKAQLLIKSVFEIFNSGI